MGFLDPFRGRDPSSRPDDLRAALLDAFQREDSSALMSLVNDNTDTIRAQFRSWIRVPESIRNDPSALDQYARALFMIAALFERSGDSSLHDCLTHRGEDDPLAEWGDDLERASRLIDNGQAAEAVPLLLAMLEFANRLSGPAVDPMRARVLGRLGIARWKTGDTAEAIRVTREALELCRLTGDSEGVTAYENNLKEIGARETGKDDMGRPVRVVFTDSEGRLITAEELPTTRGKIRWEISGAATSNPEVARLREEGRAAGAKQEFDRAISLLTQAAELDPSWAPPFYDRAFVHLLKKNFEEALADYRKTLELSPHGFFTARQTADMLEREAAGEFPAGLSIGMAILPDMPREQQQSIAEQLVHKFPSCAAGWDMHVNFITEPAARLKAIENGLSARPDADTRGSLLVKQALAVAQLGDTAAANEILKPLTDHISDSISTYANAYVALAIIRGRQNQVP